MSYTEIQMQIIVYKEHCTTDLSMKSNVVCSTEMAGNFATQAKAKKLVLTHFSQRYKGVNDNLAAQDDDCNVKKLVKEAEKVFMTGSIVAAEDFMVIPITLA